MRSRAAARECRACRHIRASRRRRCARRRDGRAGTPLIVNAGPADPGPANFGSGGRPARALCLALRGSRASRGSGAATRSRADLPGALAARSGSEPRGVPRRAFEFRGSRDCVPWFHENELLRVGGLDATARTTERDPQVRDEQVDRAQPSFSGGTGIVPASCPAGSCAHAGRPVMPSRGLAHQDSRCVARSARRPLGTIAAVYGNHLTGLEVGSAIEGGDGAGHPTVVTGSKRP